MKKLFLSILTLVILTGCSGNQTNIKDEEKITIVTTIFPEYDWVREILGEEIENVELIQLIDDGVDLHSYQPTVDDIILIGESDLFIYGGGESSAWVSDALEQNEGSESISINLLEVLGSTALFEQSVEGMEEHSHDDCCEEEEHTEDDCCDEEEHTEDDCCEEEDDHEGVYDEHFWLSLNNAKVLSQEILSKLTTILPDSEEVLTSNCEAFLSELDALDTKYEETINNAKNDVVLFGDRFPFLYLFTDYDLAYYAAFPGCSAETEASFETVAFLVEVVNDLDLEYVVTTETGHVVANTIIESSDSKDQEIVSLNSMQSNISKEETTYLRIMEENLEVIAKVLN